MGGKEGRKCETIFFKIFKLFQIIQGFLPWTMVLLGEMSVSHKQTFLCTKIKSRIIEVSHEEHRDIMDGLPEVFLSVDANLLSLDCPAVAMRLEDVMKAKSPQVLLWHCQLCYMNNKKHALHINFFCLKMHVCSAVVTSPGRVWGWRTSG